MLGLLTLAACTRIGYAQRDRVGDVYDYGDGSLIEANRDVLKEPSLIRLGQRLRIP